MVKKLVVIFILAAWSDIVHAQVFKGFTHEPQAFYNELNEIFEAGDKKEAKDFMEGSFGPFWLQANPYSPAQQEQIYTLTDALQKKRYRPFPFLKAYLTTLMSFPGSPQEAQLNTWMETLTYLNTKAKSDVEGFLTMSDQLFADNTFYSSASAVWKSDKDNWQFKFEDNTYSILFPDMNLTCLSKGDSSVIYATGGSYFPAVEKFNGKEGKVTWERAALDPNTTYAIIQNPYELSVRSSGFKLDSVLFFNSFFKYPLLGEAEDKILANVTPENASFPQFSSYDRRLSITNIIDKVDYSGGFRMEGAKFQGYGSGDEPAILTFKRENLPQLLSYAQFYTIAPDRISSQEARVVILLNNDSIVHPSLQLRFINQTRLLTLVRKDEGLSKSPYYDSYHKLDLYFEAFYWNIDDPVIRMGNLMGSSETRAAFESANYFKKERYTGLQGMDKVNPLYGIRQYAKRVNSDYLDAAGLAAAMGFQLENYVHVLVDLTNKGFISYDIPSQSVEIRPKLYDYISASAGNIDYDVLLFNSSVKDGKNAELNLVNFDLMLRGVDQIQLSDSQNVAIFPKNGEVNVRKNRNFNFGGVIRSGRFEFFGQEYAFDYDKFQIDLIAVDSCRLYVKDFKPENTSLRRVKNVIEGVGGTLQIDNPYNKSGLQPEFTEFPVFNCDRPSYVYYDNSAIQKGVYERDKVFFELEPFILDSLDNFATEQIALKGNFVSGGIFPEMAENIGVQPDYSLGFVRSTPAEGLPLYGNMATFKNDIVLNYSGLQGDGDLEYLTSLSTSKQFTFFPDSTRGVTEQFTNTASASPPQVPEANATAIDLALYPVDNYLSAAVLKTPINMYDGQGKLKSGDLSLSPDGLTGNGIMDFSGAELESNLITYQLETFAADTAAFRLLALLEANLAFSTNDVKATIDFANRVGDFKSNGDDTKVEFPVNEYICYMDQFKWFMDKNDIALETSREMATDFVIDTELDMSRSNFFSVNKEQDSLNFMSPKAVYDLDTYTITADQIPWIRVADAKITPDSGRVVIRRKAKMDPLTNSVVQANYITQYHTIENASVTLLSRSDFIGSGQYTYVDENKNPTLISLTSISVDTTMQTVASGKINAAEAFFLSPDFEYQGEVNLQANEKFLSFNGSTRIIHNCDGLQRNWMKFSASIDPNEVLIPVDTLLSDDRGNPVDIGLNLVKDPYEVYGTFLSAKRDDADLSVVTSRGYLYYNKADQNYEVAAADKLKQKNLPGNYISLNKQSCELTGVGELEMGTDLGQFESRTIGTLKYNPLEEKVSINASVVLDFFFDENALSKMETYLSAVPDLKPVDFTKSNYEYAVREMMGLAESDKVISELSLSGSLKRIPDALDKTVFISDLQMTWDPILESFVSEGDIGIASIGKKMFFRKVPGKFVVEKKASGDIVHLYFEIDDAHWYYFTYKRGLMQAYSSDKEFNNGLMELKEDKRKQAGAKKEDDYSFMLGSKSKQSIFVDQFMF